MYAVKDIAQYVIADCDRKNRKIDGLQLQRILYYLQVSFIKKKSYILFKDAIEAWNIGPIIPCIYYDNHYSYGNMRLYSCKSTADFKIDDLELIDQLLDRLTLGDGYCVVPYDACKEGGVWYRIYNHGLGNRKVIKPEDMAEEKESTFCSRLKEMFKGLKEAAKIWKI